jgi:hypothetical protein
MSHLEISEAERIDLSGSHPSKPGICEVPGGNPDNAQDAIVSGMSEMMERGFHRITMKL